MVRAFKPKNRGQAKILKIVNKSIRSFKEIIDRSEHLLTLRLTLILLILYSPPYIPLDRFVLPILCASMLVFPSFLTSRYLWGVLVILFAGTNIFFWYQFDNHHYLTNYWCIVCLIAASAKNADKIMAWNGKLLIGLCFFLATLWKIIAGQYFDGSFLHLTFLLDDRLEIAAHLFGGLNSEILYDNRQLLDYFAATDLGNEALLTTSPQLAFFSAILSYWTLFCEGIIAIAFLLPRLKWLYDRRDFLLISFILTTYPLVPVSGFAGLLAVMGFAQCDRKIIKLVYLLIFLLMPFWIDIPTLILYSF